MTSNSNTQGADLTSSSPLSFLRSTPSPPPAAPSSRIPSSQPAAAEAPVTARITSQTSTAQVSASQASTSQTATRQHQFPFLGFLVEAARPGGPGDYSVCIDCRLYQEAEKYPDLFDVPFTCQDHHNARCRSCIVHWIETYLTSNQKSPLVCTVGSCSTTWTRLDMSMFVYLNAAPFATEPLPPMDDEVEALLADIDTRYSINAEAS